MFNITCSEVGGVLYVYTEKEQGIIGDSVLDFQTLIMYSSSVNAI